LILRSDTTTAGATAPLLSYSGLSRTSLIRRAP
jgi:hypothetical protein